MRELNEDKIKNSSRKFRVNDVTNFLGITPRILKHYETTGILSPQRADRNDYREYSAEDIIKIQLAERLKNTQFSQREIGEYFSGEMNIERKYAELMTLRKMLDELIDILAIDLKNGAERFSIENEQTLLCFCKTYPATPSFLQQYLNARDAYSSAISARCVCDVSHTFFNQYGDLLTFPTVDEFDELYFKDKTYRVCVPIVAHCKSELAEGTITAVTRKKSLIMKYAFAGAPRSNNGIYLQEEAKRRGLTLTGKS